MSKLSQTFEVKIVRESWVDGHDDAEFIQRLLAPYFKVQRVIPDYPREFSN